MRGIPVAFLIVGWAIPGLGAEVSGRDPRIGTWVQRAAPGTAAVRQSFEDLGGGRIRLRLAGLTVEARCDGNPYPFVNAEGHPAGATYACRVTGPRSVDYIYTQNGREPWTTSTGTETVSADGNTLTHVGVRRDANGKLIQNLTQEYRRHE